jgi:O-antigen/teichoic acid export membrane protein
MATYAFIFLTFIGLGISLFAYDLIVVMTPEAYWRTARIIPAIVVCYIIFASESFAVLPILISGKTERLSYVNITVGVLNIGLNFWLIPAHGIDGAILATIISFVLKIVGIYWLGRRFYVVPYEWPRIGASAAIAVIIFFLGSFLGESSRLVRLPCNMLLTISFIGMLWFGGVLEKDEKENVVLFVREKFSRPQKKGFQC